MKLPQRSVHGIAAATALLATASLLSTASADLTHTGDPGVPGSTVHVHMVDSGWENNSFLAEDESYLAWSGGITHTYIPTEADFFIGDLIYYHLPGDPGSSDHESIDLELSLMVKDVLVPSGEPAPVVSFSIAREQEEFDTLTLTSERPSTDFVSEGYAFTVDLVGFRAEPTTSGSIISSFRVAEDSATRVFLYGRFSGGKPIPEPTSSLLFALGLSVLLRKRRRTAHRRA